ncbi:ABC transporter permease [Streptomyces sp. SM1P]
MVHGARHSLLLGVGATALGVLVGLLIGLPSALLGRFADQVAMRSMDVMLALPELLLALLVIAVVGPSSVNAALAIAVSSVPGYARLVRGQAQVVRRAEYIRSAIGLGLRRRTVVLRHVVPNTLGPLVVPATLGVGTAIIAGSALSFLGLGPKAPTPEWGRCSPRAATRSRAPGGSRCSRGRRSPCRWWRSPSSDGSCTSDSKAGPADDRIHDRARAGPG